MKPIKNGFTLVELSIVLVILGLLVGGVLTGQSLIRAAELRSITNQYQGFQTAQNTFRDKYFALPGDMNNATSFWGKDNTNCSADTGTAATPGTCNGNGDGLIDYPVVSAGYTTGELWQYWKHLSLAGLIEGTYTGLGGAWLNNSIAGTNSPRPKIGGAAWYVGNMGTAGDTTRYLLTYGNSFEFGGQSAVDPYLPILKPEEAWNIDTKIDDGKPATGKVIARHWNNACATSSSNTDYTGSYNLASNVLQCALFFRQQ